MRVRAAHKSVIRELQQAVASKERSAAEIVGAYLAQLKAAEGHIDAFLTINDEQALAQVRLGSDGSVTTGCMARNPACSNPRPPARRLPTLTPGSQRRVRRQ
jgi:Asp-tRNA(Asn)/Glu-tRNA(Gln) amidotransferase A subunit family amidase